MGRTHKKIGLVSLQFIENKLKLTFPKHFNEKNVNDWKKQNKDAIREFTERFPKDVEKSVKKVEPEKTELTDKEIGDVISGENKLLRDEIISLTQKNVELKETVKNCEVEKKAMQENFNVLQKSNQQLQETIELGSEQFESQEKEFEKSKNEIVDLESDRNVYDGVIKKLQKNVKDLTYVKTQLEIQLNAK